MIELRHTVRRLLRAQAFTLTTVVTLALGLGATIAIFAVVNGILINPLPFAGSDRLVSLTHRTPQRANLPASQAIYFTYRDNSRTFESVALWLAESSSVTAPGDPEQVPSIDVTFDFLPTLRVAPELGRAFAEADDRPDSPPTVMLAHGYWQRHFGGNENALGQDLVVNGVPHEIIGVLPRDFRFSQTPAAILLPMRPNRATSAVGPMGERGIARLRDGVTLEAANTDAERMIPILSASFPVAPGFDAQALAPNLRPLKETFIGGLEDVLLVLMGTIGLLLAVACANVANLQLIRTETRAHELAIQSALGASRGRIALALVRESVLLALLGGALGLALAAVVLPVLLAVAAGELPSMLAVTIDGTVVAFAVAVSLAVGIVFGAVPVLRHAGPRVAGMLRTAGRGHTTSRERQRVHRALIAAQVSFALILLVAAGLMIRSFASLLDVDPGFVAPDEVQIVSVVLPPAAVPEMPRAVRMFEQMQSAIGSLGGVESVGFASRPPLTGGIVGGLFAENSALPEDGPPPRADLRFTSPRYFETLGTRLVAGRTFEWADHHEARRLAIVSQSFARSAWGAAENALGKRVRLSPAEEWREVIGVVSDVRNQTLDAASIDAIYLTLGEPLAAQYGRTASFVVRSERVSTPGFLEEIQRAIWSVEASVPLWEVQTLGQIYDRATARTELTLVLLAITGGMALALGLVGIYGVVGYMLVQRRREIGIRVALGAQTGPLKRMMLRQIALPVLAGVAAGLAAAAGMSRLIESLLFGVEPLDARTYALATLVLVATAALAAYLPARRVARMDPMTSLRAE